jgi:Kef-type K+ transport system membrane component KefB/voltage-gated potassium channel Kch
MVESLFIELSLILVIAIAIAFIVKILRQPLIISYILTGIIAGPYFLDLLHSKSDLTTLSELGVALLLFMVGLHLNPRMVKDIGFSALIIGLGQIILTFIGGFAISYLFGFEILTSVYIGIGLAFSSTIIILKLLSDKGDSQSLYGRIAIGVLIVQDIVAIIALMAISSLSNPAGALSSLVWETVLMGLGLIVVLILISIYFLPTIMKTIAKSQELLLLFAIGWSLALASLFHYLNFSLEIGALLAGVTLSLSPYRYEISSKLRPIRDFFLLIFFILLGSQIIFQNLSKFIWPIIVLSVFVLIGKPIIIFLLTSVLGYTKRTTFLSGVSLAQISEFSFILIGLGVAVGHLPSEILPFITLVGVITIAVSTYGIQYSTKLYPIFSPLLTLIEKKEKIEPVDSETKTKEYDVILFGYNRIGYDLLQSIKAIKKKVLVVDFNPDTIELLSKMKIPHIYGDASDTELLSELNLEKVKMTISTIPEPEINLLLINKIKERNKKATIITISHQLEEAEKLYHTGASYVIIPHFLGGHHTSTLIEKHGLSKTAFEKEKALHLKSLHERKALGHKSPIHERDSH